MATTWAALLAEFLERYELGELGVTTATGDTSSVIDVTRFGNGLRSGQEYPQRTSILILTGARAGEHTSKSDFDVDLGDFTVVPLLTGAPASGVTFAVMPPWVANHFDRLLEAFNRYATGRARRWMRVPFTKAKGGDLLGTVAADWTISSGSTGAYTDLDVGTEHYQRVLHVSVDDAAEFATLTTATPCLPNEEWEFCTFMRSAAAGTTARIRIFDITNTVEITPTFEVGAATVSPFGGAIEVKGRFTTPATCGRINVRYIVDEDNGVGQFGPWIWAPVGNNEYSIGSRVDQRVGDVFGLHTRIFEGGSDSSPAKGYFHPVNVAYDAAEQYGWGVGYKFRGAPFPLFYDDLLPYTALSAVTDETPMPLELAVRGMAWEFFKWAGRRVRRKQGDPEPTRWGEDLDAALEELIEAEKAANYGPEQRFNVKRHYDQRVLMG